LRQEDLLHKNSRAEVLCYNQVFGDQRELIKQFNEVRKLNEKVSKPVLHITLSLAPGERLSKGKLEEVVRDCSTSLQFSNNQFIAIMHNDTNHQHVHIVANRIGFDGKTVSDSNNYKRMADFCRSMEEKHQLKKVLNPSRYLQKEERHLQRQDNRKQQLKDDIKSCLRVSNTYMEFEQKMRGLKYDVIKGRGIAFRDAKKVYTKGSEVGFSLANIEKTLALKHDVKLQVPKYDTGAGDSKIKYHMSTSVNGQKQREVELRKSVLNRVMEPTQRIDESLNRDLIKGAKRKRKKRQSL
jgi:hypothetical protein